ncbi:carboxypeptidase regulatory-like domain-containing protein [Shewanella sp. 10N.7]|uniref:carboxypeptidase-like regulatory domain-containing protein n=1 Tax=Shewanella sp. 10N.7 TaxID=2885093 RepID=UPI001E645A3F|nr:carboxypeptidase-like regulatory domain-containing protein [Shewanella sp. 10N.7]MCC4831303.1 carboxypeptidase regulatory-like domain-containing protein [Shewanella sp. 10N.7]
MLLQHVNRLLKYTFAIVILLLYIELVNPGLESSMPWKTDSGTFLATLKSIPAQQNTFYIRDTASIQDTASEHPPTPDLSNAVLPNQTAHINETVKEVVPKSSSEQIVRKSEIPKTIIKTQTESNLTQQKISSVNSSSKHKSVTTPVAAPFIEKAQAKPQISSQSTPEVVTKSISNKIHHAAQEPNILTLSAPTNPIVDKVASKDITTKVKSSANIAETNSFETCSNIINRTYTESTTNEEQFLVTQFNYGSERLSDEMFIYHDNGVIYLPMQFLADNLMLPLQVEIAPLTLAGWYLSSDNSIDVSQGLMRYIAQNSQCNHSPSSVFKDDWDMYLELSVVKQMLGLEITFDNARQLINITENSLIPLSQLIARQKRFQQFNDQKKANVPINQRHIDTGYANIGDLAVHADLGVSQRKQTDTDRVRFDGFIQARTDILGHSAYAGYSWSEYGESLNAYIEKEMADTWVNYYRLGSIDSHNLALVSSASSGDGVIINTGDSFIDDIRYLVVDGELEPGWDVELYRNGGLISVQRVTDNGQYRFEQVPYYIGLNQYQLRFFGPNGETRTESFSKLLDPSQMQANSFGMNFGVMQREQDDLQQVYASANWAVTDNFSAGVAIIEQQISQDKWLFSPTVSVNFLTDNSVWQINLTGNDTGSAANIIAQGSNSLVDWQAEWAQYDNFESWDNENNRLKQRANINLSGNISDTNMSWGVNGRWQDQNVANDSLYLATTIAGQLQHLSLSNELSWQNSAENEKWANRLALSGRVDDWFLRSYADIALLPTTELTQLVSNASTSFSDRSNYQFEVRYQPLAEAEVTFRNSLSYFLDSSTLRLTVENDSEGDWFAQFKWSSSALFISADNTWLLDRVSHLNTGSVKIVAFQDDNNNGQFDDNELPMAGLRFSGHTNSDNETDDNGQLLITHIQTSRPHKLVLNERSLPDPFLLPLNSILMIEAHPGNVAEVLFPVLFTAELDGEVYYENDVAAKGVSVTLIHADKTKYHARVEYDGVFIFEQLVPGDYQIEINNQLQSETVTLAPGEYVTFPTQTIARKQ